MALVRPEAVETTGRRSTVEEGATDAPLDDGPSLWARRPWLVTVVALVVLSLVAARGLYVGPSGSSLTGGALGATPDSAGAWWRIWFERGHDVGLGSADPVPTTVLLLALAATPVWFAPGLVVGPLLLLAVPLAGLTAHRLGRRITAHRRLRIVWALAYALTVVATGAVSEGRLGTVVALVVLPIVVTTTLQLADHGEAPRRTALRWGIWVAVGTAFAPVLLPLAVLGLAVLLGMDRRLARPALVGVVAAVVLVGPWLLTRVLHPMLWWWESGELLPGAGPGWRTALGLVVGRAGSPEQAPLWLGAGLVVLALLALLPRSTRAGVAVCWLLALLALAVAVLGVVVRGAVPGSPVAVQPWVGVPVGAVVLALGTAALVGVPALLARRGRSAGVLVLVLVLVLPVGTAAWWVARGVADPLDRARPDAVPVFLTERAGDTLVLTGSTTDGVQVRVVRGAGPLIGEEGLRPAETAMDELTDAVESVLSAPGADGIRALGALGIGAVYAPDVDADVARAFDAAPLVEPSGSDAPTSRVWTLVEPAGATAVEGVPWRPWVAGAHLVLWLLAIVLTAPVRRREDAVSDVDPEEVRA